MPDILKVFDHLYNCADVSLGRLVPDKDYPDEDGFDPSDLTLDTDYHVRVEKNVVLHLTSYSKTFLGTILTRLLSAYGGRDKQEDFHVISKVRKAYQLRQPTKVLREICSDAKAQQWLEDNIGGGVYMVTAIYTLYNPTLARKALSQTTFGGKAYIPVPAADLGVGGGDVAGQGGHRHGSGGEARLKAIGERIYQIRYRKVGLKQIKEKEIAGTLKQGSWKQLMQVRGGGSDGDPEGDVIVEPELEDEDAEDGENETAIEYDVVFAEEDIVG
ncbi:hypothetical protein DL765_009808 [Monosporascus sp. GIB2]|nr:hypothetical protein DL765_009808 [Monosporascus sp. GIB2]